MFSLFSWVNLEILTIRFYIMTALLRKNGAKILDKLFTLYKNQLELNIENKQSLLCQNAIYII